jgi:hypothetical protein
MPDEGVKYKRFSLLLDRSPRDKKEMIQKYHEVQYCLKTFDDPAICPEVPDFTPGVACDTSFIYILDERGRVTAERGLNNFFRCISSVLAFNRKFESVVLQDKRAGQDKEYLFFVEGQLKLTEKMDVVKIYNTRGGRYEYMVVARENHNL